ncbi:MAG: ABC transporter ATP-binding protein [Bavariicoccus seileri]|uniref:ABC transporter ATP-binding protein n=1 Tax=Bavariicoccus seileri TaxID=549685 RepID=UPI003F977DE3
MKFLWQYIKAYPSYMVGALVGQLAFVFVTLGLPTLLAQMINKAIIPQDTSALYRYGIFMAGIAIVGAFGRVLKSWSVAKMSNLVTMEIRNDTYTKMQQLSHHEFQEFGVPSLGTRITTDAFMLLQFIDLLFRQGLAAPLMIVFAVTMIIKTSPELGIAISPIAPITLFMVLWISKVTRPLSEEQQTDLDTINRIQRENITGLRVIRAFRREKFQEKRFEDVNKRYEKVSITLFRWMAVTPSAFSFIINVVIIAILWLGAGYIGAGSLDVGNLVAFIEYAFHALFSLMLFANIFMMYPRAAVSSRRLKEVMEAPISVKVPENPVTKTETHGYLEFKNVDFAYPDADEPVLRNISFKSKPGQTVAFIGSTGSGKSTIVKLIPRFYDVTKGQVLVDNVDVRDYSLKTLRRKIGFTPQKALLFSGKISENLRFGKYNATQHELEEASDIAQARSFIERLTTKYDTSLAEGGSNLSGGQKQRLSIARSIIGKPDIYIFDDSFSALDFKTDAILRKALREETRTATTIIVGQRVASIMHSDLIIVLDEGEIAAKGTHAELLKTSPIYYEIASSQLSQEELNR